MYQVLGRGKKCYQCLMNLGAPCEVCPVNNQIEGPHTYLDPIRHLYETVDAVEINMKDHSCGHAMVFSTVGTGEKLVGLLPNNEESLRQLSVINILGNGYSDILSVNTRTQQMQSYRYSGQVLTWNPMLYTDGVYEKTMRQYIEEAVVPEDQGKLKILLNMPELCEQLKALNRITMHYRVKIGEEIHYYYLKCARLEEREDLENIVFAFANEDNDVRRNELESMIVPRKPVTKRKILVVEDNELNAEIATVILGTTGLAIEHVADGTEAVDRMASCKDGYYDIIFMDIQMPRMNGYDATRAIRSMDRNYCRQVPIVAMTANAFAEDVQAAKTVGMNEHIAKPLDLKSLARTLDRWLN